MVDSRSSTAPVRFSLRTLLVVVAVSAVVCAVIVRPLWSLGRTLECEYNTQNVIKAVDQYVRSHDGRWPASWSDLGNSDSKHWQTCTHIDFTLRSEDLLRDRDLIHSAITPLTGEYVVYPHADRNLESLLRAVIESTTRAESSVRSNPQPALD